MSKYDITYTVGRDIKNMGYNYNGKILSNSLSKYLYLDDRMSGFLNTLESAITILFNSTKKVKHYFNYTIDQNEIDNQR